MVLITGLRPTPTITHVLKLQRECRRSCGAGFAAERRRRRENGDNGLGMRLKWLVSWQAGRFAQRGDARSLLALSLSRSKKCFLRSQVAREACLYI